MCLVGCCGHHPIGHYTDKDHEKRDEILYRLIDFYSRIGMETAIARSMGYSPQAIEDYVRRKEKEYGV